jgi:hypothetical protein
MERAKQIAIRALTSLGYDAKPIPEESGRKGKRADIAAAGDNDRFIVEVKQRLEDANRRNERNERLASGELVSSEEPLGYSDRVDAILRRGLKQINETPKTSGTFNLLWFHTEGLDSDLKALRARNTFYGLVHLFPRSLESPHAEATQCFYFDHNTSIRLPTVHGLIVVDGEGLQLCINEFAESAEDFRRSSLVTRLGDAVIDPRQLELAGEALILRGNFPRGDESAVLQKVHEATTNHYIAVRLNRHAVSAAVMPNQET